MPSGNAAQWALGLALGAGVSALLLSQTKFGGEILKGKQFTIAGETYTHDGNGWVHVLTIDDQAEDAVKRMTDWLGSKDYDRNVPSGGAAPVTTQSGGTILYDPASGVRTDWYKLEVIFTPWGNCVVPAGAVCSSTGYYLGPIRQNGERCAVTASVFQSHVQAQCGQFNALAGMPPQTQAFAWAALCQQFYAKTGVAMVYLGTAIPPKVGTDWGPPNGWYGIRW